MNEIAETILTKATDKKLQADIVEFLKEQGKPATAQVICFAIGVDFNPSSHRKLRAAIEIISKTIMPIQSSEKGYSIISTAEQLAENEKYVKAKIFSMFGRLKETRELFYRHHPVKPEQLTIESFLNS